MYSLLLEDLEDQFAKVASRKAREEKWRSLVSGEPEVLGVDTFDKDSVTIRVWIQTEPLQQ